MAKGKSAPKLRLPRIMGHRGAAAHAPENSLAAIRAAADLGAEWVEVDVMLTGDKRPVLFHDDSLERITGKAWPMAETPWRRVAKLEAGSWFDPAFKGEAIPSLEAALALMLELDLRPNLEIKPTPGTDVETAVAALAVLGEVWPAAGPPPLISSFSRMALAAARALRPDWPRALITFKVEADWQVALQALGCQAYHVYHKVLDWERVALIKAAGCQLASFTVNDKRRARDLYDWGVDCLISDAPDRIKGAWEASRKPPK